MQPRADTSSLFSANELTKYMYLNVMGSHFQHNLEQRRSDLAWDCIQTYGVYENGTYPKALKYWDT